MWGRLLALLAAGAAAEGLGGLSGFGSEELALAAVAEESFALATVQAADVERLVHRGWHDTVRALVLKSHAGSEEDAVVRVTSQVREAVRAERNQLDNLIRVLDRNYGKAAEVTPAVQWAQNSTHVFLTIKFAQRWNAPGALEVENETVLFTDCCLNFTAFGEHSFIRRRYHLSWELFRGLLPEASSWYTASAGRMGVTLAKKQAANWPRLLTSTSTPKNVGVWRDMKEKWKAELSKFVPVAEKGSAKKGKTTTKSGGKEKKKRSKAAEDEEEDDDALDREIELLSECPKASFAGSPVAELCGKTWSEAVEEPRVKGRRWLVKLYSSQGDGNLESMRGLMPVWKRLADVFPSMVSKGRVGALDCGVEKELCKKLGASNAKLPQVRRFLAGGAGEPWTGDLEASIEELAEFGGGGGKSEL